jgi:hypothetical protein
MGKSDGFGVTGKVVWLGLSSDLRTNRWRVTCPVCDKAFEPQTTMYVAHAVECPVKKCRAPLIVNYDDQTVCTQE